MKMLKWIFADLAMMVVTATLVMGAGPAAAQTPPTRSTPCNAATPWDAVCVGWTAVATYEGGSAIPSGVAVSYRVERATAAGGPWSTVESVSVLRSYVTGLAPGVHYFRVFAVIPTGTSDASNVSSRGVNNGRPDAPVITIAVVISPGNAPTLINLTAWEGGHVTCEVVPS